MVIYVPFTHYVLAVPWLFVLMLCCFGTSCFVACCFDAALFCSMPCRFPCCCFDCGVFSRVPICLELFPRVPNVAPHMGAIYSSIYIKKATNMSQLTAFMNCLWRLIVNIAAHRSRTSLLRISKLARLSYELSLVFSCYWNSWRLLRLIAAFMKYFFPAATFLRMQTKQHS